MSNRSTVLGFFVAFSFGLHGCGAKGPVAVPQAPTANIPAATCLRGTGGSPLGGEIVVSFSEAVDLRSAPIPINESERILFRHLYETLVRVDCEGRLHSALASRWWKREDGRVWEFELRDGARFSDGSPLVADDVKTSWLFGSQKATFHYEPVWSWVRPESIRVTGARRLVVSLDRRHGDEPGMFVHPALAVARPASEKSSIPLGSGPYLLASGAGTDTLRCEPNPFHPDPGFCPLRIVIVPGADPRDLVGAGGDVVVVHDREAVSYVASLPAMQVVPLGWDTLYLLVSPWVMTGENDPTRGLDALRRELATSIAVSEARPAYGFAHDPEEEPDCVHEGPSGPGQRPVSRAEANILFWADDADAERLASRLVALEDPEDSTASGLPCLRPENVPVGVGEAWGSFLSSLIRGEDWAYVLGLGRAFPDPCLDLDLLLDRVTWMRSASVRDGLPYDTGIDLRQVAIPLVVTRANLAYRRSLLRVELGWDGIPLLYRAGWAERRAVP